MRDDKNDTFVPGGMVRLERGPLMFLYLRKSLWFIERRPR